MPETQRSFPARGRSREEVLAEMQAARAQDVRWQEGKAFSLVYKADEAVSRLTQEAYLLFFSENGLSPTAFPSLRKFEDVIEWDELRSGRRQEGIYYGVKNFVRKLTGAVAIFFALQVLNWSGYQSPPAGATHFMQPQSALLAIRWLAGPAGAALLTAAIVVTWFYPLSRERHARIRRLLQKRRLRYPGR